MKCCRRKVPKQISDNGVSSVFCCCVDFFESFDSLFLSSSDDEDERKEFADSQSRSSPPPNPLSESSHETSSTKVPEPKPLPIGASISPRNRTSRPSLKTEKNSKYLPDSGASVARKRKPLPLIKSENHDEHSDSDFDDFDLSPKRQPKRPRCDSDPLSQSSQTSKEVHIKLESASSSRARVSNSCEPSSRHSRPKSKRTAKKHRSRHKSNRKRSRRPRCPTPPLSPSPPPPSVLMRSNFSGALELERHAESDSELYTQSSLKMNSDCDTKSPSGKVTTSPSNFPMTKKESHFMKEETSASSSSSHRQARTRSPERDSSPSLVDNVLSSSVPKSSVAPSAVSPSAAIAYPEKPLPPSDTNVRKRPSDDGLFAMSSVPSSSTCSKSKKSRSPSKLPPLSKHANSSDDIPSALDQPAHARTDMNHVGMSSVTPKSRNSPNPSFSKHATSSDATPSAFDQPSPPPPKKRKRARTAASEAERRRREHGKLGKPARTAVEAQREQLELYAELKRREEAGEVAQTTPQGAEMGSVEENDNMASSTSRKAISSSSTSSSSRRRRAVSMDDSPSRKRVRSNEPSSSSSSSSSSNKRSTNSPQKKRRPKPLFAGIRVFLLWHAPAHGNRAWLDMSKKRVEALKKIIIANGAFLLPFFRRLLKKLFCSWNMSSP